MLRQAQAYASRASRPILRNASAQMAARLAVRQPAVALTARSFSMQTSQASKNNVQKALSQALAREIKAEDEGGEPDESDELLQFKKASGFTVEETPGQQSVAFVRTVGDTQVRVEVSTTDYTEQMYDPAEDVDEELAEESENHMSEEMDDMDEGDSVTVRGVVTVTKSAKDAGAVVFETSFQDGFVMIERVGFFRDAKLALEESAQAQYERGAVYDGSSFAVLEEDLQEKMEAYLDHLGVNEDMASAVIEYLGNKEAKEYRLWLTNVKQFVDA